MADLRAQAQRAKSAIAQKQSVETNRRVSEILKTLEKERKQFIYIKGHQSRAVIETLYALGFEASNCDINCDCDPRESCNACAYGYQCLVQVLGALDNNNE